MWYGVEAGLDSNARKNRSGTTMEGILERHVSKLLMNSGLNGNQVTAAYIKENGISKFQLINLKDVF